MGLGLAEVGRSRTNGWLLASPVFANLLQAGSVQIQGFVVRKSGLTDVVLGCGQSKKNEDGTLHESDLDCS
jgi:hypothetical protein